MAKVAKDPETRRWWALTDGMQESFVEGATGSGKDIPWWQVRKFLLHEIIWMLCFPMSRMLC
jgi:hypothetical protein